MTTVVGSWPRLRPATFTLLQPTARRALLRGRRMTIPSASGDGLRRLHAVREVAEGDPLAGQDVEPGDGEGTWRIA
jgi:hypothetical protein